MSAVVEIVDITTADGVGITGAFWPAAPGVQPKGVQAWLLLPGMSGSFYSQVQRPFAQALQAAGYPCLTLSTRGHDALWFARPSGRAMGVTAEIISEGEHDIRAALDALEARGFAKVGLLGHSLGCIKSTYFLCEHGDPRIGCFAAVSGARIGRARWEGGPNHDKMTASLARAESEIAAGNGDIVMRLQDPQAVNYHTPRKLVDWYGSDKYDVLRTVEGVRVPMIQLRGGNEPEIMPDGLLEQLLAAATQANPKTMATVPGADHFFGGGTAVPAIQAIVDFCGTI